MELPLWFVLSVTLIFSFTWFYLASHTLSFIGPFAWSLLTLIFFFPCLVLWLIYLKIL
ncbi:MAG: hypothetical protein J7L59_00610 [Nanoarchaeota archaeon]|nr:hypothetical protein [Nanoarchaeota archaeon]